VNVRRSLLVAPAAPWGAAAGFRYRMQAAVEGLQRLGPVDVCIVQPHRPAELDARPPDEGGRVMWAPVTRAPGWRLRALASRARPEQLSRFDRATAEQFAAMASGAQLTWCVEPRGYEPVRSLVRGRVVLDLQNLRDVSARYERDHRVRGEGARGALRRHVVLPRLESRWTRWQRDAAADVDATVVCSELDARRLGAPCIVIPNTYPRPETVAAPTGNDASSCVVAFVGSLQYEPNLHGVRSFAHDVLPRLRAKVPQTRFRVVGDRPDLAGELRELPGVDLRGYVADLDDALAGVDAIVAPLFFGGGTRLKVLEGFARRVPVVATTIAAEGLDVRNGVELLVADGPQRFAGALLRLHGDAGLRARLTRAAAERYERRYTWDVAVDAVERLARDLVGGTIGDVENEKAVHV
jgi:glycosyltransferase involved in cell wall biosynthesis